MVGVGEGVHESRPRLLCGAALWFNQPRQLFAAVYVVKGEDHVLGCGEVNQLSGNVGRHTLTLLVVVDVSLCATKRMAQSGLSDFQPITDAFNGVHKRNTSAACL